jgi:hypothetical protein
MGTHTGGNAGAYARRATGNDAQARAELGNAGALGSLAFVYCERCGGYHIGNTRAPAEPMTYGRARAIARMADEQERAALAFGRMRNRAEHAPVNARAFDAWNGSRGVDLWRAQRVRYVGSESWRKAQRKRVDAARVKILTGEYAPHACPSVKRDVTRKCRCAAFGGERHEHRRDDGIAHRAPAGGTCGALHRDAYGRPIACATCAASSDAYARVRVAIDARDTLANA